MSVDQDRAAAPDIGALIERAQDLTAAHIESELVIMHIGSGNLFQLNRVAARIWDALEAPITVGELFARLQELFDVSPERCRTEVGALLVELQSQGLVRIS